MHNLFTVSKCPHWALAFPIFAGEVMPSFNRVVISTRGNWFKTYSLEHEHDELDSSFSVCVLPMAKIYSGSVANYDQHLPLYCGSVKPKFKTGFGY